MAENIFFRLARRRSGKPRRTPVRRALLLIQRLPDGWYELPQNPPHPFLPGQWLVCCDAWQPVTTLPHVCATCGRRYLEEERPPGQG